MKNAKKNAPQPAGAKPPTKKAVKAASPKVTKPTAKLAASQPAKPYTMMSGKTKTAKVLALLRRPGGTTMAAISKATAWQLHSVRAFVSATLGKRMGLTITSKLNEKGQRLYSVEE